MGIKSIEVEFLPGNTIEKAMKELKETAAKYNEKAHGKFNSKTLTSDMSVDEAYLLITGKTKEVFDNDQQNAIDNWNILEKEHETRIPDLTKEWIEKAKGIVRDEKLETWNSVVPIRLKDLYKGMELRCTLDLVKMLDIDNCTLEEAKKEFASQGHSGMSANLMFSMMYEFCVRGEGFVEYVNRR